MWVRSLVRKLRSHMLQGVAKDFKRGKKKKVMSRGSLLMKSHELKRIQWKGFRRQDQSRACAGMWGSEFESQRVISCQGEWLYNMVAVSIKLPQRDPLFTVTFYIYFGFHILWMEKVVTMWNGHCRQKRGMRLKTSQGFFKGDWSPVEAKNQKCRWEGGLGWGTHVNPWLFHFNVWQNPPQIKKKKW